jgi:hypothetical protein
MIYQKAEEDDANRRKRERERETNTKVAGFSQLLMFIQW